MSDLRIIYVYKDWDTAVPEKIGTIYIESSKGREVISFEYDDVWLENMDLTEVKLKEWSRHLIWSINDSNYTSQRNFNRLMNYNE